MPTPPKHRFADYELYKSERQPAPAHPKLSSRQPSPKKLAPILHQPRTSPTKKHKPKQLSSFISPTNDINKAFTFTKTQPISNFTPAPVPAKNHQKTSSPSAKKAQSTPHQPTIAPKSPKKEKTVQFQNVAGKQEEKRYSRKQSIMYD